MKIIENEIEYSVVEGFNTIAWFYNGYLHRENGPAVENGNGDKFWFKNDKIHREDGPAVIYSNGEEKYYLYGTYYPNVSSTEELIIVSIIE